MNFFITGLPRSRTAWFAAIFTATDDCFCYHDGLNGHRTVENYRKMLNSRPETFVGDSDSGLLLLDMEKLFPDAKRVVIKRDPDECAESLAEFLGPEYAETIDAAIPYLEAINGALVVDFDDIDDRIDEIYNYCTGKTLDKDVKAMFSNFWIQIVEFKYDPNTLIDEVIA
jgi:hypothetical protein